MADQILRSEQVCMPDGVSQAADLVLLGGRIERISPHGSESAGPITDVGKQVVMPGLIDLHVHLNEPGRADWEGFKTGTAAAAAGGITTLVDMPLNSEPTTVDLNALAAKRKATRKKLAVNCGLHAGVIPDHADQLDDLLEAGVLAGKGFMIHSGLDSFPNAALDDLREAMGILAAYDRPLLVHAELPVDVEFMGDRNRFADYLRSKPDEMELNAIEALLDLGREIPECPIHLVHLSTARALPILREAKAAGMRLTIETCPHYLWFDAESIPDGATEFKCGPPIRSAENRNALIEALLDGTIDTIGSDHSPCPPELKQGDFLSAWGGISSLQFLLSATWTILADRIEDRASALSRLQQLAVRRPAELVHLDDRSGIEVGHAADLVVWDPDAVLTVVEEEIQHRHKLTPYLGREMRGVVNQTWVGGELAFDRATGVIKRVGQLLLDGEA